MITKIQLKLNNDILSAVIEILEQTNNQKPDNLSCSLLYSIKSDLTIKFEEKTKNIQKQISILDHNKKHNFVLKYHEAYALYQLLNEAKSSESLKTHPHLKKIEKLIAELQNKIFFFAKSDIASARNTDQTDLSENPEKKKGQISLF